MKTYLIKFYFGTDQRCDEEVEAPNEVAALAIALVKIREPEWCNVFTTKITIELKRP